MTRHERATCTVELTGDELSRIIEALWCGPPEEVSSSEYELLAKLAHAGEAASS